MQRYVAIRVEELSDRDLVNLIDHGRIMTDWRRDRFLVFSFPVLSRLLTTAAVEPSLTMYEACPVEGVSSRRRLGGMIRVGEDHVRGVDITLDSGEQMTVIRLAMETEDYVRLGIREDGRRYLLSCINENCDLYVKDLRDLDAHEILSWPRRGSDLYSFNGTRLNETELREWQLRRSKIIESAWEVLYSRGWLDGYTELQEDFERLFMRE